MLEWYANVCDTLKSIEKLLVVVKMNNFPIQLAVVCMTTEMSNWMYANCMWLLEVM